MSDRDANWRRVLLAAAEQALVDVASAGASEVTLVRHDDPHGATLFVDELEAVAHAHGFVTAQKPLALDRSFDTFDALVRSIANELVPPTQSHGRAPRSRGKKGLIPMLDAFVAREGRDAAEAFEVNARRLGAGGDLFALARAYLEARATKREAEHIEAWLNGVELARAAESESPVAALSARTAKRALGELTRLVRALGFAGCLFAFTEGETLLKLTPHRRDDAYTVMRELVDNTDGGRGLVATRIVVIGTTELFEGVWSLAALTPLAMRMSITPDSSMVPPPHRPLIDLTPPPDWDEERNTASAPQPTPDSRAPELRALVRASQGLPPVEAILSMSVGHEKIDVTIDRLFEHAGMQGSVFALLTGAYGSGKTHLLLHLAARALGDRRPVFRLSLERLDADLGNPQRHLRRMLENAILPLEGSPSPLDLVATWTRSQKKCDALTKVLAGIAEESSDAAAAAARALRNAARAKSKTAALETFLGGTDLASKPGAPTYRHDAYTRLLLWVALLERMEKCGGPVLIIDEAENLYKGGSTRSERRTALRSLSFYCGGALPGACVVVAITPEVLATLREESRELLEEVDEQVTALAWEDAAMLRRRLHRIKPEEVPALTDAHRAALAGRVRATHAAVRGKMSDPAWTRFVEQLSLDDTLPREVVRRSVERLEGLWWGTRLK